MRHAPSVQHDSYPIGMAYDAKPPYLPASRPINRQPAARVPSAEEMRRRVVEGAGRHAARTAESLESRFPGINRIRQG